MQKFKVGILSMQVRDSANTAFVETVESAGARFADRIEALLPVDVQVLTLTRHHFVPSRGAYEPLDFLEVGIGEKIELGLSFLIVVTEVELASKAKSYVMAMASQATNIGLVSTSRLRRSPMAGMPGGGVVEDRLTALLVRTFARLLNLPVVDRPTNIMRPLTEAERLDELIDLSPEQAQQMMHALPREAFDRATTTHKLSFTARKLVRQFGSILRVTWAANPFRLLATMPTMLATALSVILVMLFGAETWDFAAAVAPLQLGVFIGVAFAASTFLLYRAFSLPALMSREGALSESVVVTSASTLLSIFLALFTMFAVLALTMFLGAETVFPDALKRTWTTVDDALQFSDHLKISLFLATVGILSGSLGGAADNRALIRRVLFVREDG